MARFWPATSSSVLNLAGSLHDQAAHDRDHIIRPGILLPGKDTQDQVDGSQAERQHDEQRLSENCPDDSTQCQLQDGQGNEAPAEILHPQSVGSTAAWTPTRGFSSSKLIATSVQRPRPTLCSPRTSQSGIARPIHHEK